ncbi:MAG: hypothetical protein RJA35_872 [Actinomycetota bacterium]
MKATQNQLQDLLELAAIDHAISRSKLEIEALGKDARYQELQVKLRGTSADFVAANNQIDALKLEIKRMQADVELVEKRVAKDQEALKSTSVVKNAQGLQQELKTLERRKQELEDQELDLMQGLETAEKTLAQVTQLRTETEAELKDVIARLEKERARLISGIELSLASRKQLAERLPEELTNLYANKSKRGVAVGRLIHSECGACHMNISATNLADLLKAPADELVYCPDCAAILVR